MKKLIEKSYGNTKQKITQYLITKLKEYQERLNGIKSETSDYLFKPLTAEFVLDNKDNVWVMTTDIHKAKLFNRKSWMDNLILKTYNLSKSTKEKLRWMSMIKLSGFNVNLTPVVQINENVLAPEKLEEKKELTLDDIDNISMDEL